MMASDTRLSAVTAGLFPVISDEVVSICSSKHLRSTLPQSGTGLLTGPTTSFNSSFTPCVSGSGLGCLGRIYFDSQPCPILQSSGQSHGKPGIRWWKAAPSESSLWHRSFCLFSSFIISQHHILLRSRDVASCGAASLGYNDADSETIGKSASTTIHRYTLIMNRWRNALCRQQKSIDGHRCVIESIKLATSATLRPGVGKAVQVHDGTAYQVVLDQWSIFQRGKWKCISTFPSARSDGLVRHAKFHLIIGFRHRRSHAWTSGIQSGPFVGDLMFRGCSDGLLRTFSTFSAFSTMRALQGRSSSDQNLRSVVLLNWDVE